MKKDVEQKINQLQLMESNLQSSLLQKRTLQIQLLEVENALKEISESKDDAYKIVGNIMIKTESEKLIKELAAKKEFIEVRLKSIENQEKEIMEKAVELQKDILKESK